MSFRFTRLDPIWLIAVGTIVIAVVAVIQLWL